MEGGYRFTGRKSFGSLTPVWTYLGHPRHGHAAIRRTRRSCTGSCLVTPRDTGSSTRGTCWACARRRATTRSSTGCSSPDRHIARVVSAGAAGIDHFVLALFAWALHRASATSTTGWRATRYEMTLDVGQVPALDCDLTHDGVPRRAPAHDRRDDAGAGHDRAAPGARRGRLVDRRESRRRHGRRKFSARSITLSKARGRSWIWRSRPREVSVSSGEAGSNSCSAMPASGASTRPTRC